MRAASTNWRCVGLLALFPVSLLAQTTARSVRGVVVDPFGQPVAGATVSLVSPTGRVLSETLAGGDGAFAVEVDGAPARVIVRKAGFRRSERELPVRADSSIEIRLEPEPVSERVTVVATRRETRLGETPASVVVVGSDDLRASAAPTLDDALRQVPGFTLFRRSGSRSANPTSQGVSLRGAGASGASRALVLDDGVPLNDPFGGWVYWGRAPRASLDRVEVLRGGGSDLWGGGALAGVVNLVRREPESPAFVFAEASYGGQETAEATAFAGVSPEPLRLTVSGEVFRTAGYVPVAEEDRGSIDVEAGSRRGAAEATLEHRAELGRVFLRGAYFEESRDNGTPYQVNDTAIRQVAAGAERALIGGALLVRAWGSDQDFHQTFSAIAADRSAETATRAQEVPADSAGLSLSWIGAAGPHAVVGGIEGSRSRGESREEVFLPGGSRFVTAGGEERVGAVFAGDTVALSGRSTLSAALRLDSWERREGRLTARSASDAAASITRLPDRRETAWSPRVSFRYRVAPEVALSASAYRAFRPPTGNELYRGFRVGNVETRANEGLAPERLAGIEGGATISAGRLFARAVVFAMEIEDAIANVTLSETPELVLRQRRNLGRIRSRGLEVDADARIGRRFRASAGYLFADSTVRDAREAPELVGLATPQVARHQATAQLRFEDPALLAASLQARWIGAQYEDDRNRLELAAFTVLDAVVSREVLRGLDLFVAAENVFDERADVGRTPVRTIGAPRTLRVGLRLGRP